MNEGVQFDKFFYMKTLTEDAGKAEIAEFDNTIPGEQDVFRFDISMNTVVHVTVVDSLQRLPDYACGCWHRNSEMRNNDTSFESFNSQIE